MKKCLLLFLIVLAIPFVLGDNYYVQNPNNCPSSYQSQTCSGSTHVCGYNAGVTFCYDPASLSAPGSSSTTGTGGTSYSCSDNANCAGYIVDCYSYDGGSPFCDTSGNYILARNTTCFNKHTQTTATGSVFGSSSCSSTCTTNYFACDGSTIDADGCEIQVTSCNGGHGNIVLNQCYSASVGNCTKTGNYADCDNDDSDSNNVTCNGATNGCEINVGTTANNTHNHYTSCNSFACDTNYLDCDGNSYGNSTANGCEINIGGACSVGPLSGIYGATCSGSNGNCIVSKSAYYTGNQTYYSTNSSQVMIGGVDYGNGNLVNFTNNGTNSSFIVTNNSGVIASSYCFQNGTCLSSGGFGDNASWNESYANTRYTNFSSFNTSQFSYLNGFMNIIGISWSLISSIPNLIYGVWSSNNANNLLISNGTAIGYNETVLNNSIQNVGVNAGFNSTFNVTYNAFYNSNSTIVRLGNFNCSSGQVLMNVTVNSSGIFGLCVAQTVDTDTDTWKTNYTFYYNKTLIDNNFTLYYLNSNPNNYINGIACYQNGTGCNNYVNITTISNTTIVRSGSYNCGASQVLMNVTINSSGIFGLCVAQTVDTWKLNYTKYYNSTQVDTNISNAINLLNQSINNSYFHINEIKNNITLGTNLTLDIFHLKSSNLFIDLISGLRGGDIKGKVITGTEMNTGYSYCESILLYKGVNGVAIFLNKTNDYTDRNASVATGWNMIGYSADISYPVRNIKFTNNSGYSCYYNDCLGNGKIIGFYIYVAGSSTSGLVSDILYKGDAFMIKMLQPGNLTFEKVGGGYASNSISVTDLRFSDGFTELNITDAGNDTYEWLTAITSFQGGAQTYDPDLPDFSDLTTLYPWQGYIFNMKKDNIYVIINNATCLGKFNGNVSWTTNNGTLTGINTTQMQNNGGTLTILVSWLTSLFYQKSEVYNKTEINSQIINNQTYLRNNTSPTFQNITVTESIKLNNNATITRDGQNTSMWISETGNIIIKFGQ